MDGKIPERNDKTAERKAFKVISDTAFTVFTVTGLQEKNPKSHSSFQKNQKMSPNCIVLRTLTWTSHVFHKGENRVFRTLSAPVTRIELSTARAASGESDANWPPTSIFYLVFLRNCQFQNHENQASTQKEPISISTKKNNIPLDVLVCCFCWGCFQHTEKGSPTKQLVLSGPNFLFICEAAEELLFAKELPCRTAKTGSTNKPQKKPMENP